MYTLRKKSCFIKIYRDAWNGGASPSYFTPHETPIEELSPEKCIDRESRGLCSCTISKYMQVIDSAELPKLGEYHMSQVEPYESGQLIGAIYDVLSALGVNPRTGSIDPEMRTLINRIRLYLSTPQGKKQLEDEYHEYAVFPKYMKLHGNRVFNILEWIEYSPAVNAAIIMTIEEAEEKKREASHLPKKYTEELLRLFERLLGNNR